MFLKQPVTVDLAIKNAYSQFINGRYPQDANKKNIIISVYKILAQRYRWPKNKCPEDIAHVLHFVFDRNAKGITEALLPNDYIHFKQHYDQWIHERIMFLKKQPDFPLGIHNKMVDLKGQCGLLRHDLNTFQDKLNQFELKKRQQRLQKLHHQSFIKISLMALCLISAAMSYGLSLFFILIYALWQGYQRILFKQLNQSILWLNQRIKTLHAHGPQDQKIIAVIYG